MSKANGKRQPRAGQRGTPSQPFLAAAPPGGAHRSPGRSQAGLSALKSPEDHERELMQAIREQAIRRRFHEARAAAHGITRSELSEFKKLASAARITAAPADDDPETAKLVARARAFSVPPPGRLDRQHTATTRGRLDEVRAKQLALIASGQRAPGVLIDHPRKRVLLAGGKAAPRGTFERILANEFRLDRRAAHASSRREGVRVGSRRT